MHTKLINIIKLYPKVTRAYLHEGEQGGFNPTYQNIEACGSLLPYQKRIWVLRSDFNLALGIKNLYVDKGNTNLFEKIDSKNYQFFDPKDRFGHPSLAVPEKNYDGSVYYAGWLIQFPSHVEIILHSGRFHNNLLSIEQRNMIEKFISIRLMDAWGFQDIVFIDSDPNNPTQSFGFFKNQTTRSENSRVYTPVELQFFLESLTEKVKLPATELAPQESKLATSNFLPSRL